MRVLVSGCYDVLHAGHVQFFRDAKSLGTHLTVCVATGVTISRVKLRRPALPDDHRIHLVESLEMVDDAYFGSDAGNPDLNFLTHQFMDADILAVTTDGDRHGRKRDICSHFGKRFVMLDKGSPEGIKPVSSTEIRSRIMERNG